MGSRVDNQLATIRRSRGIGASDLARRVGVSRQTIYAIEAGTYVPNTEVTLRMARELEVSVEELFSLPDEGPRPPGTMPSEILSATAAAPGQAVRLVQIDGRTIGIPVSAMPYFLPEADGVVARLGRGAGKAEVTVFAQEEPFQKRLLLAGCDPATSLLARTVERLSGVELISAAASSRLALTWLREGKVHIAGSHLEDAATGEFNLPYLRREFPGEDFAVVTFARWEEGLVVAPGNPKQLLSPADLARPGVTFMNREEGSGSRGLLDRLLETAGLPPKRVRGYERIALGHLAAAYAVASFEADACIATRSAARTFGLDFVALRTERYDLVLHRKTLELPAVQTFLDVLQRASLRRKLEVLAGYDTAETGSVVA